MCLTMLMLYYQAVMYFVSSYAHYLLLVAVGVTMENNTKLAKQNNDKSSEVLIITSCLVFFLPLWDLNLAGVKVVKSGAVTWLFKFSTLYNQRWEQCYYLCGERNGIRGIYGGWRGWYIMESLHSMSQSLKRNSKFVILKVCSQILFLKENLLI